MSRFSTVRSCPSLQAALEDLFNLTRSEYSLSRLIGEEPLRLAKFLLRSQVEGTAGARWGDVETLSNMLWDRAEKLMPKHGRPAIIPRLMEIADRLTVDQPD